MLLLLFIYTSILVDCNEIIAGRCNSSVTLPLSFGDFQALNSSPLPTSKEIFSSSH